VEALTTDFLSRLVDPEPDFQEPLGGVYEIQGRNAECFSALVQMARFNNTDAPICQLDYRKKLFEEADLWGVQNKLKKIAHEKALLPSSFPPSFKHGR
jgi:hypothetical protein